MTASKREPGEGVLPPPPACRRAARHKHLLLAHPASAGSKSDGTWPAIQGCTLNVHTCEGTCGRTCPSLQAPLWLPLLPGCRLRQCGVSAGWLLCSRWGVLPGPTTRVCRLCDALCGLRLHPHLRTDRPCSSVHQCQPAPAAATRPAGQQRHRKPAAAATARPAGQQRQQVAAAPDWFNHLAATCARRQQAGAEPGRQQSSIRLTAAAASTSRDSSSR